MVNEELFAVLIIGNFYYVAWKLLSFLGNIDNILIYNRL